MTSQGGLQMNNYQTGQTYAFRGSTNLSVVITDVVGESVFYNLINGKNNVQTSGIFFLDGLSEMYDRDLILKEEFIIPIED
jgi:hypothetical protein